MKSAFLYLLVFAGSGLVMRAAVPIAFMPVPSHVSVGSGEMRIAQTFTAGVAGAGSSDARVKPAVSRMLYHLFRQTGIPVSRQVAMANSDPTMLVRVDQLKPGVQKFGDDESYRLTVSSSHIELRSKEPLGAIRGLETFLQLVQLGAAGYSAPVVEIADEPRFGWRGLSLDVSRHFLPVEDVERTIDGLSAVKLNVFHWHLSDDQGFRVESRRYPLLQGKGSDGLFYTQQQVREVVEYARARGVRVVPEFDVPAHATSWFAGYPQLGSGAGPYQIVVDYGILPAIMDPTRESTYVFLDGLFGEMTGLFPDAYFHVGGDEVNHQGEWATNQRIQEFMRRNGLKDQDALQAYFNRRVLKIVTRHGKKMEGWDEILQPGLPKNIVIQSWRGQKSLAQAAREGYQGLLSAGYYLDVMQSAGQHYAADPLKGETAGLRPAEQKLILGGEAAMWMELATEENIDAKLWPRLAAIAERLWSPESVTDTADMYRRLDVINGWLEGRGLRQRAQLRRMQERLAGTDRVEPVATLASLLEPIQGYKRHRMRAYTTLFAYNQLIDAIAPESEAARHFNAAVDRFLASPANSTAERDYLREHLAQWKQNGSDVAPVLNSNPLLGENVDLAKAVSDMAAIGLDAVMKLSEGQRPPGGWKQANETLLHADTEAQGEFRIPIAAGVRKLVEAAGR